MASTTRRRSWPRPSGWASICPASRMTLVEDGVKQFAKAADDLLGAVAAKRNAMLGDTLATVSIEAAGRDRQGGAKQPGRLASSGQGAPALGARRRAVDRQG